MCVCVCVREREMSACVCVREREMSACVCVRERPVVQISKEAALNESIRFVDFIL